MSRMQIYTHVTVQAQTQVCQLNVILSCLVQSYLHNNGPVNSFLARH